jgi:hypothetical protein
MRIAFDWSTCYDTCACEPSELIVCMLCSVSSTSSSLHVCTRMASSRRLVRVCRALRGQPACAEPPNEPCEHIDARSARVLDCSSQFPWLRSNNTPVHIVCTQTLHLESSIPLPPRHAHHLTQTTPVQWYVHTTQDPAAGLSTVQPQDRRYRPKAKSPALVNINTLCQPLSSIFLTPGTARSQKLAKEHRNRTRNAVIPVTNQACPINRRKAPTSRRPSPSSTSAVTAVSHSLTWATSSEHAARTRPSQRSRTLRARWAATVRRPNKT